MPVPVRDTQPLASETSCTSLVDKTEQGESPFNYTTCKYAVRTSNSAYLIIAIAHAHPYIYTSIKSVRRRGDEWLVAPSLFQLHLLSSGGLRWTVDRAAPDSLPLDHTGTATTGKIFNTHSCRFRGFCLAFVIWLKNEHKNNIICVYCITTLQKNE